MNTDRGKSKVRVGMVVGTRMEKTAVVKVERRKRHPRFLKYIRRSTKYLVHDEQNQLKVGDKVRRCREVPWANRSKSLARSALGIPRPSSFTAI